MSMQPMPWPEPAPEIAAAVRASYRRREPPLPVAVRDRLGELFADARVRRRVRGAGPAGVVAGPAGAGHGVADGGEPDRPPGSGRGSGQDLVEVRAGAGARRSRGSTPRCSPSSAPGSSSTGWSSGCWTCCWPGWPSTGWWRAGGRAAHRLHPCDRGGAGSEPAGAGRGERAGRPGGAGRGGAGLAGPAVDVPGWSRRYRARVDTWRLPTSHDQARRAGGGLRRATRWRCCARCYAPGRPGLAGRAPRRGRAAPGAGAELP